MLLILILKNVKFYPVFSINTPGVVNKTFLDVSAGVVLNTEKFYFGISWNHLNKPSLSKQDISELYTYAFDRSDERAEDIVINSGYQFSLGKSGKFFLIPSIKVEITNIPKLDNYPILHWTSGWTFMSYTGNVSFKYKNILVAPGLTESHVGWDSKNFRVLYSFGYGTPTAATHEISMRYLFNWRGKA